MIDNSGILIAGGYGQVGRRIAAELAPLYPSRVLVAGRDIQKAEALADQLGNGVRSALLDINHPATIDTALNDVRLVVNCVDQSEPHLLRAALARGLAYIDITAHITFWHTALALSADAQRSGACILLGAGLVPGIANVMARAGAERVGAVERVDTAVLLSMGDSFGAAALDYMLASASEPFVVSEDGRERTVHNFSDSRQVGFPSPIGRRTVYRFALPEQVFYPRTLGARTATTRIALDPPWVTAVCAGLARVGATALLRRAGFRRAAARIIHGMRSVYRARETYSLVVDVRGTFDNARLSLVGKNESHGTALGAALMAQAVYEGGVRQPGVWLPEQVIDSEPFLRQLQTRGLPVQMT